MDEVGQRDAPVPHLCLHGNTRSKVVELLAIVGEGDKPVAVIDLDVKEFEHDEAGKWLWHWYQQRLANYGRQAVQHIHEA
jgi:hypothetical protein